MEEPWGGPGVSLGVHGGCLGGPWGSWRGLGRCLGAQGGPGEVRGERVPSKGATLPLTHLVKGIPMQRPRLFGLLISSVSEMCKAMVGLAQREGEPDPVSQALVLTGIVVAIAATALALVLIRRYYHLSGETTLAEPVSEKSKMSVSDPNREGPPE